MATPYEIEEAQKINNYGLWKIWMELRDLRECLCSDFLYDQNGQPLLDENGDELEDNI